MTVNASNTEERNVPDGSNGQGGKPPRGCGREYYNGTAPGRQRQMIRSGFRDAPFFFLRSRRPAARDYPFPNIAGIESRNETGVTPNAFTYGSISQMLSSKSIRSSSSVRGKDLNR